ncbi:MAG: TolC family protein [Candidatus Zixiibacteriota bacterium]
MMIFKRILFLATLFLFMMAPEFSEARVLSLDDCITEALKNHPDVVRARGQVKRADGVLWQSFGAFLPNISAGGSVTQINSEPGVRVIQDQLYQTSGITKNYDLGLSAGLTVFDGGQNIFNYLGARADKSYYKYLSEQTEQNLILTVKTTYYSYLASERTKEIREEAVKRGEEQLKLAQSKFDVGSASKSDVLKAKVQYGNDKLSLLEAENAVSINRANLAYLIGIDVNSDIEFSRETPKRDYSGSENEALKFGLSNHPGLLSTESKLSAARYGVKSIWGRYAPSVSVRVSRGWTNEYWGMVNDFSDDDARWTISTSLDFTIFDNFSRKAAMASAKASLNDARVAYHYQRNSVANEIKKAYLDMNKAFEALKLADENESAATEDMALVQEKYNLGAATILELLDAQVSLITAQNSKIQAEFDLNLAIARLENAMGKR